MEKRVDSRRSRWLIAGVGTRAAHRLCGGVGPTVRVMMLPAVTAAAEVPDLASDVVERIRLATIDSQSEGTRRAYASAWRRFEWWCQRSGYRPNQTGATS